MTQDTGTLTGTWGADIYPKLSWFKQAKVQKAHVMVVGCGALGNEVLKNLVLFGVEHIVAIDFDTVEASNLTRSIFFSQEDAKKHRYKVDVIAERLRQINPKAEILPIKGDIAHQIGLGLIKRMDVAISCVDNRYARYCLNRLCMRAGIPWVDGGIDGLEGTARVFAPGKNCYACNLGPEGLKELSRRMPCSAIIRKNEEADRVPTTPVIASIIAAVEVQEALKLIHREEMEKGELTSLCGKMFYYEGQHLTSRLVAFQAYDADCPVHEQWAPTLHTDLTTAMTVKQALMTLTSSLHVENPRICLRDFSFVDYITDRSNEQNIEVMLPSYRVAEFMEQDEHLRYLSTNRFYQHEIHYIDATFPYPHLTLGEIGIPANDIFIVTSQDRELYVEMKDEHTVQTPLNK